jgi:hypothetical protein
MATVTKGKTFASGEVVTPLKIHQLVDNATVTGIVNADIDANAAIAASKLASTLDFSTNTVTLPNTSVTAAMLANTLNLTGKTVTMPNTSVTDAMLANTLNLSTKTLTLPASSVAAAAIAANAVEEAKIASNAVVEAKIANAAVTPAKLSQPPTMASSQASTSGSQIDFTGIPSWANRVTISFDGVSVNGTNPIKVFIGDSGGIETSSYVGCGSRLTATAVATASETGSFTFNGPANASVFMGGHFVLTRVTGNTWAGSGILSGGNTAILCVSSGAKTLSAPLDRVRIECSSNFDAGNINIMYEG